MDQISWMIGLIPDAVLTFLVHAGLVAGVVLSVLGIFAERFPFVGTYAKLAKLVGIPLLIVSIFFEGGLANEMRWRAQVDALKEKVKEAEKQSEVANTQVDTTVKQKIKVVKEVQVVVQERIKEVEKRIDAECKVDPEAISILNQAAGGKK
jgi:high-affinity K+ transport system ATPase subunit B